MSEPQAFVASPAPAAIDVEPPSRQLQPPIEPGRPTTEPGQSPVEASNDSPAGAQPSAPAELAPAGELAPAPHCASVPPLRADGSVPPAPPHPPLGQDVDVPGDRPLYLLPGAPGDKRVIIYLHGMCGDVTAGDYFREALRAHGSLLALRGDTACSGDRFKWRDDPPAILRRIRAGISRVNQVSGTELGLEGALLFGYSQGAERAQRLAAEFPKVFARIVLGGPPMRASPVKLRRAARVAILGGELETTETMRAGASALQSAGIDCRYFMLECAYHGYYGTRAEAQLLEVLDWVSAGP